MTRHTGENTHTDAMFESLRPQAFRIAYRILGTVSEAEDVVQDAWLRWHRAQSTEIRTPKAWITTVVTRLAIDQLRAAKTRREVYPGPWLPTSLIEFEDVPDEHTPSPEEKVALADDVSLALLMVLEHLTPEERAAFILREAFDTDYPEIARILGKSEAACRQLVSRAGKHIKVGQPRFTGGRRKHMALHAAFLEALQTGDVAVLGKICADDAVLLSDGGGKAAAALNPIYGRDRITRFFGGIFKKWRKGRQDVTGMSMDFYHARINDLPGLVSFVGDVAYTTLAFEEGRNGPVKTLYITRNPDKLDHIARPGTAPLYSLPLA
ncbi:RNA polymerase sigma factor SigJ [Tepidicaulis sp. LMO-SS28]|uniref:RNA polymerase sigma factor SigJ n=1 Tax=Tepidicaulis sp. LMO-SS28 TaxID=3447455 RepID=UPI003EDF7095